LKNLVALIIVVCAVTLSLSDCPAFDAKPAPFRKAVSAKADKTYENATLTEDVTWRGTVLIKGYLVVAPQATLRIEPGTNVRFARVGKGLREARLVIMGRIQSVGTAERPILFASDAVTSVKGDWAGILLLSTEKNNQFEQTAIEGADSGMEARFSNFIAKSTRIILSHTGLILHDSVATIESGSFSACDTGIEVHDSEFEIRNSSVSSNRTGMVLYRSSLVMAATGLTDNEEQGMQAEECRLRLNTCDLSGNAVGAWVKGGEGQVFMTRFMRNKEIALHLVATRLKVNRSVIAENGRVGLRVEDGRSTVWGCDISANRSYNLYNSGDESVSAVQNWWGTDNENAISAKIFDSSSDTGPTLVQVLPWLYDRPSVLP
jgi:hypothetical protein